MGETIGYALSDAAYQSAVEILDLIEKGQNPSRLLVQMMPPQQVMTALITVAGQVSQGEVDPDIVLGALFIATTWISGHFNDNALPLH
ncbi:MAG: hypothetical protein HC808_09870 [Candidatus Competibacteraceae bacterium]|nr:hypothetical protein [Candidatus Competibacteraceae bacterium]